MPSRHEDEHYYDSAHHGHSRHRRGEYHDDHDYYGHDSEAIEASLRLSREQQATYQKYIDEQRDLDGHRRRRHHRHHRRHRSKRRSQDDEDVTKPTSDDDDQKTEDKTQTSAEEEHPRYRRVKPPHKRPASPKPIEETEQPGEDKKLSYDEWRLAKHKKKAS